MGPFSNDERSACGVGFVASRRGEASHDTLQTALSGAICVEHRGGFLADGSTGDGCGVMLDIPFDLLGYRHGEVAVATIFLLTKPESRKDALRIFEDTFTAAGLDVIDYRCVPVNPEVLGVIARETMPEILHAIIAWPACCRTESSFNQQLYLARQRVRTTMKQGGFTRQFFCASLSTTTIVYKALTRAEDLPRFYEDLRNPAFKTRFGIFHRRFSTNTRTTWDKAQPFRLIAHNGEINTIAANHSRAYSREQALGLPPDELLTHNQISDSGALNGMVEALKYRSSIPQTEDVLAIMIPPASRPNGYYQFWSRAMEAWDGPAFVAYCDGRTLGARLDRNGFRPCRWAYTDDYFYLASEAGVFDVDESEFLAKGALGAGSGLRFDLHSGLAHFRDPSSSHENEGAHFDARLRSVPKGGPTHTPWALERQGLFLVTKEEVQTVLLPMIRSGEEPIGSMGDTARLAILSNQTRSFFDFFYQTFAQVTNPPLDYLRERMVTDLRVHLGKQPNIFSPKELIPPMPGVLLESPILGSKDYRYLVDLASDPAPPLGQETVELHTVFARDGAVAGFRERLNELAQEAAEAASQGVRILILTDRMASREMPPMPCLLALRAVVGALNRMGLRLECSLVVASGEVRSSHHVAALVSFGASAVCPVLPLEIAESSTHRTLRHLSSPERSDHVVTALESGLLKIMSKMGISVVRSYRSAKLFTAVGLGDEILSTYFKGLSNAVGGLTLNRLAEKVLRSTLACDSDASILPSTFLFREQVKGLRGERHSMTSTRSHRVHEMLEWDPNTKEGQSAYQRYLNAGLADTPTSLRHLFKIIDAAEPMALDNVEPALEITRRFGAGAMSFGAISAQSQRDIILAMRAVGGRSNSGEGGENPSYFVDGTTATTKQVASGRFGVTAEFLISGREIEIKIAQGAKPGEGGQLMASKVGSAIAKARHASPNVDLISPPPMHDIYSIEDLKELIFELRQLAPNNDVCVKLVAGVHIGTIAAGVVKAGANVIQISGGDGGTGAATLVSMKHAGLPWEIGLVDVHQTLCDQSLRSHVKLRVDGGLSDGRDVIIAAALGADEFSFGKLLLLAQGCVMARVCEKNTCPRGIATHDPKFGKKYAGSPQLVERLIHYIAEDVRRHLSRMGVSRLEEVVGRTRQLCSHPDYGPLIADRTLRFDALLRQVKRMPHKEGLSFVPETSALNQRIVEDAADLTDGGHLTYEIRSTDRAVLARWSGVRAQALHAERMARIATGGNPEDVRAAGDPLRVDFEGSAGQGFGVFLVDGIDVRLFGEANDSVCKSMSGGRVIITPHATSRLHAETSTIIGNCALYGATGGELFVRGLAGDRFAVRNSGATAVIEGVGLHACGYMTGGKVVILGTMSHNVGAGMTGGVLYCRKKYCDHLHPDYITARALGETERQELEDILRRYAESTKSDTARRLLMDPEELTTLFAIAIPKNVGGPNASTTDPQRVDDRKLA
jgi:glutamate synthase domain-containing protein 2/glutamate synthase domain-containing protein 1/glutamate synthase domain-containing protein 3